MILDPKNPNDALIFSRGTDSRKVGLTSGCFDLLHHYHLLYLERCRRLCDILVVGVDSDMRVKKMKGDERPIAPEHVRLAMVHGLRAVDAAFVMNDLDDFLTMAIGLNPKVIFRNQEWAERVKEVVGRSIAPVVIVPDVVTIDSTTGIISHILRQSKGRKRSR